MENDSDVWGGRSPIFVQHKPKLDGYFNMTNVIPLEGGNLNSVVRIGNTVRRPRRSWSDATVALLGQLQSCGFKHAPRFLGFDEENRETLTYLEGHAGFLPQMWTDHACRVAAQLLKAYHSAATLSSDMVEQNWQYVYPDHSQHEVICHNDFAPYNLIFNDSEPTGLIDFDMAGPGPKLRDIAMGVYWFAPLSFSGDLRERSEADCQKNHHRLRLFCKVYGAEPSSALIEMLADWLVFMAEFPYKQVQNGHEEYQVLIDQGHTKHWRQEAEAFAECKHDIISRLSVG